MPQARKLIMSIGLGLIILATAMPAHAYIDPGTGSAILQGILAALAAIALTAKLYWHRLLKLLGLRKDTVNESDTPRPDDADRQPASRPTGKD